MIGPLLTNCSNFQEGRGELLTYSAVLVQGGIISVLRLLPFPAELDGASEGEVMFSCPSYQALWGDVHLNLSFSTSCLHILDVFASGFGSKEQKQFEVYF